MFLDESGLLMAPLVRRTWAPSGQTPRLLQKTRSTEKVSAIAALTISPVRHRVGLYVSLLSNRNVRTAQLRRYLATLRRHIRGPIILIWDRLNVHRAKTLTLWMARQRGMQAIFLPPYAPDLNPVELFWSYLKYHRLANYAARTVTALSITARRHLRHTARRQSLLRSFIRGTPLSSCLD